MPANGSGPIIARAFHRALALISCGAWISLALQVPVLIGSRGLAPVAELMNRATDLGLNFSQLPTLFWWNTSDLAVNGCAWLGAAIALIAMFASQPKPWLAASAILYLSYCVSSGSFLAFQWDSLLIEATVLSLFLPRHRTASWAHFLMRVLLFKLYFESGLAKWQSHLGDWHDGSAMTFYYETAPLPTWLAWYAHQLPDWWHHIESWFALGFELVVPLAIFAPRSPRLVAAAIFTAFQLINAATANYGFFCYLSVALHLFLLDDKDMAWARDALRRALPFAAADPPICQPNRPFSWPSALIVGAYLTLCTADAADRFADIDVLKSPRTLTHRLRIVNTYHLFGHITRSRIEPEFQTWDGATWTARDLRYKAGAVDRRPTIVAPHQPRVDFRLWFYGLSYERGAPSYVVALLTRMCTDPEAIESLFAQPLPPRPKAARIAYWDYRFSSPDHREETGQWWTRSLIEASGNLSCAKAREED